MYYLRVRVIGWYITVTFENQECNLSNDVQDIDRKCADYDGAMKMARGVQC